MTIQEHISLAPLTTFKIGGPARFFVRVGTVDELKTALAVARDKKLTVLLLGGGSNVLINDEGFDGLVIHIDLRGIEVQGSTVVVGAGEAWDTFVSYAVERNLWGVENLSGIPGTVGGAVAGSIGAYGQSLSQTLSWVEVWDSDSGTLMRLGNAECHFGYRESIFSHEKCRYVIVRAGFVLQEAPRPELSYKDLRERFKNLSPGLKEIREAVRAIRAAKFPDLSLEGTAGSFFKNPVVSAAQAQVITAKYPHMPIFTLPETGGVKIPLAWLLDHVLHLKGFQSGGARLFEKQPLVVVTNAQATSNDVKTLAREVKQLVKEKFQIEIEEEVCIV